MLAIPKAKNKAWEESSGNRLESSPSTKMVAQANDKATRLQLYVRDRQLIKDLKLSAFEEENSISQLFEELATRWLEERS